MDRAAETINGAEIVIYTDEGGQGFLDLSPLQLIVTLKALGYRDYGEKYSTFGEKTLQDILDGKINPFKLSEVENEQE